MKMRWMVAMALSSLLAASSGWGDESAGFGSGFSLFGSRSAPPYRAHAYNYPHAIPPDYAYRTGRVFSPYNLSHSASLWRRALYGGNGEAMPGHPGEVAATVSRLAGDLVAGLGEEGIAEYSVAVSTVVNLNNLYATSALGRYVGEQLIGELQRAGVEVVDVRKTPGLMVSERHGEYGMSRDMNELGFTQSAQATLVGTYTVNGQEVLLNARLLRNQDNVVLASSRAALPMDALVAGMLADENMPAATQVSRVGVRSFPDKK
ncbi:MAG: FlgO family outer membrane protein [Thermodesulfobacteriota bacterium]